MVQNNDTGKEISLVSLKDLNLDVNNPRFGMEKGARRNQTDVVDFIVENFGVEDVISSLAYNGYFSAEPLIALKNSDNEYVVVEGNRRLAACLILAGADRSKNQTVLGEKFAGKCKDIWTEDTKVPVQVFEHNEDRTLLHSYLGVRHIMSAKAWDSYAKAAWIDEIIRSGEMNLDQISQVTGDKNRTIERLLEGFYFINQLRDEGLFDPASSLRKGRGSNPLFPFSWVYTLLNYPQVREWLGLVGNEPTNPKPVKADKRADSAAAVTYMFGNKITSKLPAIDDSRQLSTLAGALADPVKRNLLAQGYSIGRIEELTRAPVDQLTKAFGEIEANLTRALELLADRSLSIADAAALLPSGKAIVNRSVDVYGRLKNYSDSDITLPDDL
ncbi:hypothetical protein JLK41_12195 [Ectopseudomonas khazarica]|uniref:hypothetical protein n=1 Tax=Ectopseudomonas khazarica TaxID=2502979 RepID=UPI001AEF3A52|nr:hypothetical protein [Pseudomonas khazarica]QTS88855.1 hypothetical protein JLK41_12195 [Pseudomonas khazarica]